VSNFGFITCWDLLIRGKDGNIDYVKGEDDWMIISPGSGELSTPVVVSFSGSFYISLSYLYAF